MSLTEGTSLSDPQPQTTTQQQPQQQNPTVSRMTERFDHDATPRNAGVEDLATDEPNKKEKKKRSLFGFGKKKEDSSTSTSAAKSPSKAGSSTVASPSLSRDVSKLSSTTRSTTRSTATSPTQSENPFVLPSSPGRGFSSSSRLSSPAGSQIFERDVQETLALKPNSPAIPAHIQTENYIPPVLDASSEAITDTHIDPDEVEIITHNAHQPAAVTVTGAVPPMTYEQMAASWAEELGYAGSQDDAASNYGSFDTTDVRRLSFISFADVVQAEHAGMGPSGSRESMHLGGLTSLSNMGLNRSPSPIRSPISSPGAGPSPPTSKSGSVKGFEMSPTRKPLGSPTTSSSHNLGVSGELNIETMSQALRRTGSGDLSGVRSLPQSPIEGPSR
jgi:hypothetical protein